MFPVPTITPPLNLQHSWKENQTILPFSLFLTHGSLYSNKKKIVTTPRFYIPIKFQNSDFNFFFTVKTTNKQITNSSSHKYIRAKTQIK